MAQDSTWSTGKFAVVTAAVFGGITTLVEWIDKAYSVYSTVKEDWFIFGPLTYYVGLALVATLFWTFVVIRPFLYLIVSDAQKRRAWINGVIIFGGMFEMYFALREGSYSTETSSFAMPFQIVGGITIAAAAAIIYLALKPGTIEAAE